MVTRRFGALVREACLPSIRLHGLRRGPASITQAAGVDLKVVSDMIEYYSAAFSADVYTSLFTSLKRQAAEAITQALG